MKKKFIPLLCIMLAFSACNSPVETRKIVETTITPEPQNDAIVESKITYQYNSFSDTTYSYSLGFEYWDLLSKQGKMYYDAINNIAFSCEELHETLHEFNYNSLEQAFRFYCLDHPEAELFDLQLTSSSCGQENRIDIGIYSTTNELQLIQEIDLEILDLVAEVINTEDKVQQYTLIHDWIIMNVEYDYEYAEYATSGKTFSETNSTNLYGAIVEKKAVCDGISDAFKYICNKCNLECVTIPGVVGTTVNTNYGHQWNIVCIEDNWFLVDCTFDLTISPRYIVQENLEIDKRIPMYSGVPGYYDNSEIKSVTYFRSDNNFRKFIKTKEGIEFLCSENYVMSPLANGELIFMLEKSAIAQSRNKDFDWKVQFSSNANIYKIEFFDYKENLITTQYCNGIANVDFDINDTYIHKVIIYIKYKNQLYSAEFVRYGI